MLVFCAFGFLGFFGFLVVFFPKRHILFFTRKTDGAAL